MRFIIQDENEVLYRLTFSNDCQKSKKFKPLIR